MKLFLECQRNNYLYVGHVLRVWFEGMPAAIGWPGGGTPENSSPYPQSRYKHEPHMYTEQRLLCWAGPLLHHCRMLYPPESDQTQSRTPNKGLKCPSTLPGPSEILDYQALQPMMDHADAQRPIRWTGCLFSSHAQACTRRSPPDCHGLKDSRVSQWRLLWFGCILAEQRLMMVDGFTGHPT